MSKSMKNIIVRTIKNRMAKGESLEDILVGYTKLTEKEKDELRAAIG